ncbi:MAG TPA: SDR family oxidoreductase [bacterium]|nr:SDR family oxidoreductase [Candidatus Omnitrophota bacterium]HOJ60010.1 SDR family oxidoreductase [bacterium]HOL93733.1 SDR family oxidoreductase [bacterium]HPP01254.1 SDR family oxidoreductase [bacterium]HXK93842.1 SDR family oxidoreductase [bacterium]
MLRNEIVMISGGGSGIGLATALRLGARGARVSLCGRRKERLAAAVRRLREQEIEALAVRADVSQEEEVEQWFAETEHWFGAPTILVNNAGIPGHGPMLEITEAQWDLTMRVNCRGAFLCTRRALPFMMQARRGRILFISSVSGQYYRKNFSLYFASKWALSGFAHCVAKEVQEYNIHVHVLCPGMTETDFFETLNGRPHSREFTYLRPDVVASMAEFLVCLPEDVDTNEYSLFPSFQLKNFGIRR